MREHRADELRRTLAALDAKLLSLLAGGRPLDDADLRKATLLEVARGAALRLLLAAEAEDRA